ncbi:hypothetical protein BCK_27278 (plasmid) [Bacillus cereus FRI-35]|nr:hypothetical protein BCK_27278 [Bacillus cereus FRI-35]
MMDTSTILNSMKSIKLFVKLEFNEQLRVCELISPPIVQRHENGYFSGKKVDTSISIFLDPK